MNGAHRSGRGTDGTEEAARLAALSEQLEDLLDQVWACEAEWRFDDRVDVALKVVRRRR